jgi:YtkA-like protein
MQAFRRYPIPIALAIAGLIALGAGTVLLTRRAKPSGPRISADIRGHGYSRTVVARLQDRKSGTPVCGAKVRVQGTMDAHGMTLIDRPLRELSCGTYRGPYTFVMPGTWAVEVDVMDGKRTKAKASFPVAIP